jgi:hypothetical protein
MHPLPILISLRNVLWLGLLPLLPLGTHAQVILVDNTGNLTDGSAFVGFSFRVAQGFTMPSTSGLSLQNVSIPGVGSSAFTVSLYSDSGGLPGSPLETLTLGGGSFSGTSPLSPSTTYWVVVGANDNTFHLLQTTSDSSNAGSATLTNQAQDQGSGWSLNSGNYLPMSVTAVPEPAQLAAAMGIGLFAFALIYRCRKSAA